MPAPHTPIQYLIVAWGILGVLLLLGRAMWRLATVAVVPLVNGGLQPLHWVLYGLSLVLMGYFEGFRAFHRRFSPRTVKRALHLAQHPRPLFVALAPLYCMGLVHATRRRLVGSWIAVLLIVAAIITLRMTPQPWRGIVDAGVAAALASGSLSILYFLALGLSGGSLPGSAELPGASSRT